jgi:hypothetical protein
MRHTRRPGPIALTALSLLILAGAVGVAFRGLARPDEAAALETTAADGVRAQRKLSELARYDGRTTSVTLDEAEINALLSRHLVGARGVGPGASTARLIGGDRLQLITRMPLRQLIDAADAAWLGEVIPGNWLTRPVWLRVGAHVHVDGRQGHELRLDVEDFAIGRQRLPTAALRHLVAPAVVGLLRWPLPYQIDSVRIEPGRMIIRAAS